MSRILQRQTGVDIPVAVGGDGIYVIDKEGKRYVDATGGPSVACLGHGDPDVRRAISDQMEKISYVSNQFFTTEAAEELADILIAGAPPGIASVVYTCGGSEAVETAMKMARQYYVETGEPGRHRFIARRQSYHGTTLGALAVGGHVARRAAYEPMLMETSHIAPCYAYRGMAPGESEEDYGLRVADELEAEILKQGPETVAAFFAETVVGAALGAVPPVPGYFRRVRQICDRYGVLLVLDEIMSGMGRTGTQHACEQEGIAPDLMTVAKGLGAGYQPIGAVLVGGKIVEAIAAGSGTLMHGLTYMAHPVGCAAALAVQHAIRDRDLLANVRRQGAVPGRGAAGRAAGPLRQPPRGLICYPIGGNVDGRGGDVVMVSPPFIVSETQVHVGDIRGRGLFWGLELRSPTVAPRSSRSTPSLSSTPASRPKAWRAVSD